MIVLAQIFIYRAEISKNNIFFQINIVTIELIGLLENYMLQCEIRFFRFKTKPSNEGFSFIIEILY